jgi:Subtilase family
VWSSSNYGKCVDLFAPGVSIRSAWISKTYADNNTNILTGTSTSTPYVTGVVALYMERYPNATPQELRQLLIDDAQTNVVRFKVVKNDHQQDIVRSQSMQYMQKNATKLFKFPSKGVVDKIRNIFQRTETVVTSRTSSSSSSESPNRLLNAQGVLTIKKQTGQLTVKPMTSTILKPTTAPNLVTASPKVTYINPIQSPELKASTKPVAIPSKTTLVIKPILIQQSAIPSSAPKTSRVTPTPLGPIQSIIKSKQPKSRPISIVTTNPLLLLPISSLSPTNKLTLLEMTHKPSVVKTIVPSSFIIINTSKTTTPLNTSSTGNDSVSLTIESSGIDNGKSKTSLSTILNSNYDSNRLWLNLILPTMICIMFC